MTSVTNNNIDGSAIEDSAGSTGRRRAKLNSYLITVVITIVIIVPVSFLIHRNGSNDTTTTPFLRSFGTNPPPDNTPLGLCEGPCQENVVPCQPGLYCFRRVSGQDVPGCLGGARDRSDDSYCSTNMWPSTSENTPSNLPSLQPTNNPIPGSADSPITESIGLSTAQPSNHPASNPPTKQPVDSSVMWPSSSENTPSNLPSLQPTNNPIPESTDSPITQPIGLSTEQPSNHPASNPPTKQPVGLSVVWPSSSENTPSNLPSLQPTNNPILESTDSPITQPIGLSTAQPSNHPASNPPTKQPVGLSVELFNASTAQPTFLPRMPSIPPTPQPMNPQIIMSFGSNPPSDVFPLDICQGDCDDDSDCREGLVCFQRDDSFQAVYGCIGGVDDESEHDYCVVDPNGPVILPYEPGKLTVEKLGLSLSEGLDIRLVTETGERVAYRDGTWSPIPFHKNPDAGATFRDNRGNNPGGWVYVSNCEVDDEGEGGVGALTFDASGNVIDYKMVATGTTMNCGGGRTPWETWVTCEEIGDRTGNIYQVDPFGERRAEAMTLGSEGGQWESFTVDVRDWDKPRFFATEDHERGCLRRFTPNDPNAVATDLWRMLHVDGVIDYLLLSPIGNGRRGAFEWTTDRIAAMDSAEEHYPDTEGIDHLNGYLYFVSKKRKWLFTLNLDVGTYTRESTELGLFDGQPDQLQRIVGNGGKGALLYFSEDHGRRHGIHARDGNGAFYTILESADDLDDETTGLAFSPDGTHMYMAFQDEGKVFDTWRRDGLSFEATHLDVKYRTKD